MVKRLGTSSTTARRSLTSQHDSIFAPPAAPAAVFLSYRLIDSAPMAVGPSVWLARQSGTLPGQLRDPVIGRDSFSFALKSFLFRYGLLARLAH